MAAFRNTEKKWETIFPQVQFMMHIQNVILSKRPTLKMSHSQNVPLSKRPITKRPTH
jgi:hypothetical protein